MSWTPEYHVRLVSFPLTVRGVTIPNDDGSYDIYLNDHLTIEQQESCLRHELVHIKKDHFADDVRNVEDIEREANQKQIS